jgi:hypothetical protein
VVCQREAGYREVLDMWEKILVGRDIVNHTGTPLWGKQVKSPEPEKKGIPFMINKPCDSPSCKRCLL